MTGNGRRATHQRAISDSPLVLALVSIAVTVLVVGVGVAVTPVATERSGTAVLPAPDTAARSEYPSRSGTRVETALVLVPKVRPTGEPIAGFRAAVEQRASTEPRRAAERPSLPNLTPGSNRSLGYRLMVEFGFGPDQWPALDALWTRESRWNHTADNPISSAYGIPQALTSAHSLPAGYMNDPAVQVRWGLTYIKDRYGNPDGAWAHSQTHGWY